LRAAALDAVSLAAASIHAQRETLLAGGEPELDAEVLVRTVDGRTVVARLLPLSRGAALESESAKLDLNATDPEALRKAFADADPETQSVLDALIAARPAASIDGAAAAIEEAKRPGALRAILGPMRALGGAIDDEQRRAAPEMPAGAATPLVARIGVHAREPLVDRTGGRRIDVIETFGSSDAARAREDFDDAVVDALEKLAEKEQDGEADDGRIAAALASAGASVAEIARVLDACTLHAGTIAPARLDIMRADAAVLATLPGLDADRAARIVELRDGLADDERGSTAWLVERRVLSIDEWSRIAGRISARSTAWRFRIEAHVGASDARSDEGAAPPPGARIAFDCIVDAGGEVPRIAYLRDITLLPTARLLARERAAVFADDSREPDAPTDAADAQALDEVSAPDPEVGLEMSAPSATIGQPAERRAERGRARARGRDVVESE
ncbi:MAG: hypothetical protein ACKO0W_05480, partial [Planctomycetota bacterium]